MKTTDIGFQNNLKKVKYRENNEIVIIGGDHHNTLAIIRAIGKKNVNYKVLIHGDFANNNETMVSHSRYAHSLEIVDADEKSIVEWLLKNKSENYKQVIIPASDIAEYTIDNNYTILSEYYYIPGFKDIPGKVCNMMNKYEQYKWSNEHNIPMAKSWNIKIINNSINIPTDIVFPCIVKPNVSAFGEKCDIRTCENYDELEKTVDEFIMKMYDEILIQEFLIKDYEVCAFGVITKNLKEYYGGTIRKIRESHGRSLTFAKFISDLKIEQMERKVINALIDEGYVGLYDIEFLVVNEKIYLNEINFRHSGNGYALIKNGINAPYLSYMDLKGMKIDVDNKKIRKGKYLLDEIGELNLVKMKEVHLYEFIIEFMKASCKAIFDIFDIQVTLFYFLKKIKK